MTVCSKGQQPDKQADRHSPCQMLVNEINSEASNGGHPTDDDSKPGIISYSYLWKVKAVAEPWDF